MDTKWTQNCVAWLFGSHLPAVRQQSLVNFVLLNGRLFLSFVYFTAVYSMPVRPAFLHNDKLFSTWWPSLLKLRQSGARLALMTWKGLGAAVTQWPSSSQAAAQWPWERDIKGTKTSLLTLSSSSIVILVLSTQLPLLFPLLSHDVLTLLSRLRLSSEELIFAGAYSWSSTTPTYRARGEHPRYTTGTLISENSTAFLCVSLTGGKREEECERTV